jgi:hypothetical protein
MYERKERERETSIFAYDLIYLYVHYGIELPARAGRPSGRRSNRKHAPQRNEGDEADTKTANDKQPLAWEAISQTLSQIKLDRRLGNITEEKAEAERLKLRTERGLPVDVDVLWDLTTARHAIAHRPRSTTADQCLLVQDALDYEWPPSWSPEWTTTMKTVTRYLADNQDRFHRL